MSIVINNKELRYKEINFTKIRLLCRMNNLEYVDIITKNDRHTILLRVNGEFRQIEFYEEYLIMNYVKSPISYVDNMVEICYPKKENDPLIIKEIDRYLIPDLNNIVNEYMIPTDYMTLKELFYETPKMKD